MSAQQGKLAQPRDIIAVGPGDQELLLSKGNIFIAIIFALFVLDISLSIHFAGFVSINICRTQ